MQPFVFTTFLKDGPHIIFLDFSSLQTLLLAIATMFPHHTTPDNQVYMLEKEEIELILLASTTTINVGF